MKRSITFALISIAATSIAQVSHKELQAAKTQYLEAKKAYVMAQSRGDDSIKVSMLRSVYQIDSLTYEGFKSIRKDQMIPSFLKK